jgi:hypothetical protein
MTRLELLYSFAIGPIDADVGGCNSHIWGIEVRSGRSVIFGLGGHGELIA